MSKKTDFDADKMNRIPITVYSCGFQVKNLFINNVVTLVHVAGSSYTRV